MNKRLKILYASERGAVQCFLTKILAETLGVSSKAIKMRAARERWKSFECSDVGPDGKITKFRVWDAVSMPEKTRIAIAASHYAEEEANRSLYSEVSEHIFHMQRLFPHADTAAVQAALYRNKQFSWALDASLSLELVPMSAIDAIAQAFSLDADVLQKLAVHLGNGSEARFLILDEDTRFAVLLLHFSRYAGVLLPEFSHITKQEETVLQ